jgi:hypothetical protein
MERTIVWTDHAGTGYTIEEVIAEAKDCIVPDIIDGFLDEVGEEDLLIDYAHSIFRCGCDTEDAWHALVKLDRSKAESLVYDAFEKWQEDDDDDDDDY